MRSARLRVSLASPEAKTSVKKSCTSRFASGRSRNSGRKKLMVTSDASRTDRPRSSRHQAPMAPPCRELLDQLREPAQARHHVVEPDAEVDETGDLVRALLRQPLGLLGAPLERADEAERATQVVVHLLLDHELVRPLVHPAEAAILPRPGV